MNPLFTQLKKLVATQKQINNAVGVPIERMEKVAAAAKKTKEDIKAQKAK